MVPALGSTENGGRLGSPRSKFETLSKALAGRETALGACGERGAAGGGVPKKDTQYVLLIVVSGKR